MSKRRATTQKSPATEPSLVRTNTRIASRASSARVAAVANSPVAIRALEPDDWRTVERLFGANGACGGCWCMWWRVEKGGKTWEEAKGAKNRARMQRLVRHGTVHAVLAFDGDEPIGWCSFGPRTSFPRLVNSRVLEREASDDTWSIVCFFVPAKQRGKGLATRMLRAASERAFELGARAIEGYPVVPRSKTERMPAAFAWTGVPAVFEAAGYTRTRRPRGMRPIYTLESSRLRSRPRRHE